MRTFKLFVSFLLVSALSATVAVGVYSYLNRDGSKSSSSQTGGFDQSGFHLASYAEAAENTDFTFAAEQSVNAVVHIKSVVKPSQNRQRQEYIDPFEFFFGNPFGGGSSPYRQQQQQPRVGFGSGVIISTDGYIVTNNHVIEGADEIEVSTNDDKTYTAKLIGSDEATDIALLKIDAKGLHVLPFGDSDMLKVGQWVLAVGNPLNLTSTVTAGIVSAIGRGDISSGYPGADGEYHARIESYIQTDAAVNPGNSGGALVNTRGELIGINAALVSRTGNYIGYSFAIPANLVKKVAADIKEYGQVQRAVLGIYTRDLSTQGMKDDDTSESVYERLKENPGVYVKDFSSESSPSKKAGIEKGDIITSINGARTKSLNELKAQLSRYTPGDKVKVEVERKGSVKTITVELKNDQGTTEAVKYRSPADILGGTYKELSREAKMRLGLNYGLEVTEVGNGKLKAAGIKNGFIILNANDTRINSEATLIQIVDALMKEAPDERGLYIRGIYPGTSKVLYVAIDLNE
ncbi:MAG: Do family serine endopeptidase [Dysgonamonadaceae bacterium]|jgi:Do/DeqQ family serine protease|nr:Do family serine endopeptidase [Dysgonamonadaceae bacterium]